MSTVTAHSTAVLVAALALTAAGSQPVAGSAAIEEEEHEGRAPTAIELVPSVEAAFRRESYAPGETGLLVIRPEPKPVRMQLFRVGPEKVSTYGYNEMQGVPVTPTRQIEERVVRVAVGDWPSGLYFARRRA